MRPRQWAKNAVVLAGVVFSRRAGDPDALLIALGATALFCLLSSSVYLVNDLVDVEEDRRHPTKRHRPIASGALSPGTARLAAVVLALLGLTGAFAINIPLGLAATAYYGLTLLYHFSLKHVVIIDVLTVAAGFVVRAVAGAVAIGVEISHWLYICTTLLALFLALAKRRQELILLEDEAANHRRILTEYTPAMLDQMITIVTATTLMAYCLYTYSDRTVQLVGNEHMILTVPFVIYGILRYLYLVHRHGHGAEPDKVLFGDKPIWMCVLLYVVAVVLILYWA
jgi:4-hydroxybenzoate polyprenyltransferase